jgi:hypothetical protein
MNYVTRKKDLGYSEYGCPGEESAQGGEAREGERTRGLLSNGVCTCVHVLEARAEVFVYKRNGCIVARGGGIRIVFLRNGYVYR